MRGAKSGFSNSRNKKCGQVTFFGVDIHVIITYIYIYIWYAFDAFACVLRAIYFLGFYMFKIRLFPRLFFSSLSGPMRFPYPADTTDR